jgi:hypothetical protein
MGARHREDAMGRLVLAVVLLTSAGMVEASACNFVNFRFFFGTDSETDMMARSGEPCSIPLITGGRASYSGIVISRPARGGRARADSSGVTYQSKPGFKGADSFAFTVSGTTPFRTGSTTVEVRVTVQ